jgi:phospholipid/cholesterol/gamma-HCH transport system substrate-binding protein
LTVAILRDDDPRFQRLTRKIGVFVLVALAGVVVTVVAIGLRQELFTPKTRIHLIAESAEDISAGMAVKLSGFAIGKVERLALTDLAQVRVTLAINSDYMKWIRADSRARLLKEGLIGAAVIEVLPGTPQAKELAEDAQISFGRDKGLARAVDDLYVEIVPLVRDLKRIAAYIDDPNGDIKRAVADVRKFTGYLDDPEGGIKQALRHADELIVSLQATQKRLDALIAAAQQDVPPMLTRGREAVEGGKKVVESLKQTWPIRGNIEPERAEQLPLDSYRGRPPAEPRR